jgi:histidinol phosphatase-like PHP family hydrolase
MFDFHIHSILSDGELLPVEIARRMHVLGNTGCAITDHVDFSNIKEILTKLSEWKEERSSLEVEMLIGVEITHAPPEKIDRMVSIARNNGAEIIIVHGETLAEPVELGTNLAGVRNPEVDILAHPGLLTLEEAEIAKENGVFLEISTRKGHCLANGHVASVSKEVGCDVILNTDSHSPEDLVDSQTAFRILRGSGFGEREAKYILEETPSKLLRKLGFSPNHK